MQGFWIFQDQIEAIKAAINSPYLITDQSAKKDWMIRFASVLVTHIQSPGFECCLILSLAPVEHCTQSTNMRARKKKFKFKFSKKSGQSNALRRASTIFIVSFKFLGKHLVQQAKICTHKSCIFLNFSKTCGWNDITRELYFSVILSLCLFPAINPCSTLGLRALTSLRVSCHPTNVLCKYITNTNCHPKCFVSSDAHPALKYPPCYHKEAIKNYENYEHCLLLQN